MNSVDQKLENVLPLDSNDQIFSGYLHNLLLIAIFIVGLGYRIGSVFTENGMLHADEVFQSFEIAHDYVFGYGHIAPEFRTDNTNPSFYAKSRSFIFPLIFVIPLKIGTLIGIEYYLLVQLILILVAINGSLIIPVSYKLILQLTKNRNAAFMTALWVSIWFRFIEYYVRPFSNTFFLPYFFYSLYLIDRKLEEKSNLTNKEKVGIILGFGVITYVRTDLLIILVIWYLPKLNNNNN